MKAIWQYLKRFQELRRRRKITFKTTNISLYFGVSLRFKVALVLSYPIISKSSDLWVQSKTT